MGVQIRGVDFSRSRGLLISEEHFHTADLENGFEVAARFDLAQSLEVAEHLSPAGGERLVNSLAQSADVVIFSAAPPGQGGEQHVNERPYEHWRDIWESRGFRLYDAIRPLIAEYRDIPSWYRFNMFLFANSAGEACLPADMAATAIPSGSPIPDMAPAHHRFRRHLVRRIPGRVQDGVARFLGRVHAARRAWPL